jgi:hypothetical protein
MVRLGAKSGTDHSIVGASVDSAALTELGARNRHCRAAEGCPGKGAARAGALSGAPQ